MTKYLISQITFSVLIYLSDYEGFLCNYEYYCNVILTRIILFTNKMLKSILCESDKLLLKLVNTELAKSLVIIWIETLNA